MPANPVILDDLPASRAGNPDHAEALRAALAALPASELEALELQHYGGTPTDKQRAERNRQIVAGQARALLERVQGSPSGALTTGRPVPKSVNCKEGKGRTFPPCGYPQHLVVVDAKDRPRVVEKRCERWTCPGCRPYLEARDTWRIERTADRDGADLWLLEVPAERWEATQKRINRAGGVYARSPIAPDAASVFVTVPVAGAEYVHPDERHEVVAREVARRPVYEKGEARPGHLSSSLVKDSETGKVAAWLVKPPDSPTDLRLVGYWTPDPRRDTVGQVREVAARHGIATAKLEPSNLMPAGVRIQGVTWNPERQYWRAGTSEIVTAIEGFLRDIAFVPLPSEREGPPLSDDWTDELKPAPDHRDNETPLEVYDSCPEAQLTFAEAAA